MPRKIVPVILCGGAGSRLWPVSRQLLPKQFLPLVTGHTLLQDTALRAKDASSNATPIVLEPAGRSTAAAVAVAALACEKEDPVLLVLASDHAIHGTDAFNAAVTQAAEVAGAGMLVTFGIAATRPDSG